jgi:aspartate aminotransferase
LPAEGRDIINLGIGQPDFKTPEHIVEAAIKALRDGHHGYTPAAGHAGNARSRLPADPDHDRHRGLAGKRDDHAGRKADHVCGDHGCSANRARISSIPIPGFPIYRSMIEHSPGRRPVPVPMREENGFAFSAEETLSLITPQTRLLILNSPANPTGGVTPRAEIDALVKGLAAYPARRDPVRRDLRRHDL